MLHYRKSLLKRIVVSEGNVKDVVVGLAKAWENVVRSLLKIIGGNF